MSRLWRGVVVAAISLSLTLLVLPRAAQPTLPTPSQVPEPLRYVALGDSYTAGPGIPAQRDRPAACRRSSNNYPAMVAAELGARLIDVSCGGARTRDLTSRQRLRDGVRASGQLTAVDRRTDLVTLGIGANEFGIFGRVFGRCCRSRAHLMRDARRVQRTTRRAVRRIHERAPDARVIVVGYPRMLPAGRGCRVLEYTPKQTRRFRVVWARVNTSLSRAAKAENVEYVNPYPVSNKHHACSRQPWVNGSRVAPGSGTAFHPTPEGMVAMSRLVLKQILQDR